MKNKLFQNWVRSAFAVVLSLQMVLGGVAPATAAEAVAVEQPEVEAAAEGMILDSSWELEKGNDNFTLNDDGSITITTEKGTIGDANGMNNVLYRKLPASTDYVFTVKVSGNFAADYQGSYLMITSGKNLDNAVGVVRRCHSMFGGAKAMGIHHTTGEKYQVANEIGNEFYLRLQKNNGRITGYYATEYSAAVNDWSQVMNGAEPYMVDNAGAFVDHEVYVALAAGNGGGNTPTDITFSELKIDGNDVAFGLDEGGFYSLELTGEGEAKVALNGTKSLSLMGYNHDKTATFDTFDSVEYTSANERVATVSADGKVTGKRSGVTQITATATIGGVTRTAVYRIQVGEIRVDESWEVVSPNENVIIQADLMTDGSLQYSVRRTNEDDSDYITVIPASPIGLVTNMGDFSRDLVFKSAVTVDVDDTYTMYSGKRATYSDKGKETTLTFTLADDESVEFDFIMRAYEDGAAYRYAVRSTKEDKTLIIRDETSAVQLPAEATIYWMNYNNAKWNYEGQYAQTTTEGLQVGSKPSIPFMFIKNDIMTIFTEADLTHGTYTGSRFTTGENGLMNIDFVDSQTSAVETTAPFASPWRVAITGNEEDIIENTLVESLSPAADEETYKFSEWVKPGLSSWSWVANWGGGISDQSKAETHKNWIDLGEQIGWRYYILDEGWASSGRGKLLKEGWERDWFQEVKEYAAEKGVELIAWVHVSDIDTAEEREKLFSDWQKEGIKGIKPDFFDSENQDTMQLYEDLYRDAAKYHLIVNVHGANKPTGEIRTWPNIYGREAIRGQEAGRLTAQQYTVIPFIRAAVGPAEVTEEINSKDGRFTTQGFQVALTVVVENGLHSMGSRPSAYTGNAVGMEYYKNFPERWVETKYVDGTIGEYVSIARQAENTEWYLSGIAVGNEPERNANDDAIAETEAVTYEVPLKFLDADKAYVALHYSEDGRNALKRESSVVTAKDTINVSMLHGGGYAVRLISAGEILGADKITDDMKEEFIVDLAAAQIGAIGTVTLDSEASVEAAKKVYESLSEEQKELITNYDVLEEAEKELNQLLADKAAADKAAADKAAADAVIEKINAIGSVALGSKDSIEAAKKAYGELTKDQQALVTNYATLTSAETKLAQLQKEKAEKDAAEKKAAEEAAKEEAERATLKKGKKVTIGDFTYKITKAGTTSKAGTVELVKPNKKTMKKVTIPATVAKAGITFKVTSIADKAFQSNKNLTTVTIGKNVTKIGKKAFYKDSKLKTVKVSSKSIKSVGKQAFKGVNKKIKITVPKAKKSAYKKMFGKSGVSSSKVK